MEEDLDTRADDAVESVMNFLYQNDLDDHCVEEIYLEPGMTPDAGRYRISMNVRTSGTEQMMHSMTYDPGEHPSVQAQMDEYVSVQEELAEQFGEDVVRARDFFGW